MCFKGLLKNDTRNDLFNVLCVMKVKQWSNYLEESGSVSLQ